LFSTLAFACIYTRRKKRARQRAYTEAVYTSAMTQRHSFFDPTLPTFEEIPRPPPIPPRRRPVPAYRGDSGGATSPSLTLGTAVYHPGDINTPAFYSTQYSPAENVRNPFQDPSPISGFSELPLLNRPLRSNSSSEGHGNKRNSGSNDHSDNSRPPSPAPSNSTVPSLYPPTVAVLDDTFTFGPSPRPSLNETRPANPFDPSPLAHAI